MLCFPGKQVEQSQKNCDWQGEDTVEMACPKNFKACMLEAEFDYRAMPFWAWNGKLEPEELRRQVRIMHDMGMNGFFMHSRLGLATGYLQEEWFECIKAALD